MGKTKHLWFYALVCMVTGGALLIGMGWCIGRAVASFQPIQSVVCDPIPPETGVQSDLAALDAAPLYAPETEAPLQAAHTPDGPYLLKLTGETLAVYAVGDETPFACYQLMPAWLPDYDRILLEYGIEVEDTDALHRLLEDYLS